MAVVTPPQITPPPPKPQRGDKATFRERVDDFITWMIAVVAQFAALATNVFNNAQDAAGSAGAANTSAINANTAKTGAETARTGAETARTGAETARTGAETARTQAQAAAAALRGTSVNALTIGVGSKSLTTETGRQFDAGQTLKLVVVGNGEAWMSGRVTSYNSATGALVVNVLAVASAYAGQGSNTWNLYVAGEVGPTGPMGGLSGGNATGAVNLRQAAQVPVSATPDIWSGAGNVVRVVGDGTITGFPDAPQVGASRTLLMSGTITLVASASLIVYGGTYTSSNGDLVEVLAENGVNVFRVVIHKRDGTPVAHDRGALHNLRVFGASGILYATKTGWHKITVVGTSGSSGIAAGLNGGCAGATGAGAGGFISGMRWLTAGTPYVVTVAAPPAAPAQLVLSDAASVGLAANGNTADITQFSGPGITSLTANGGYGGQASVTPGATIQGGIGGSAYGAAGDFTSWGGNGGSATLGTSDCAAASGGGAVALRGMPMHGGNAITIGVGHTAVAGGAGVGGRGGNATGSNVANTASSGGGSAGPAADITDAVGTSSQAGYNFQGTNGGGASFQMPNDLESATGGGGQAWLSSATPGAAAPGGGSGGDLGGDSNNPAAAGMFAGAGGVAGRGRSGPLTASPGGGYGGAPGGIAATRSSNSTATIIVAGRPGRSGGVWIEF